MDHTQRGPRELLTGRPAYGPVATIRHSVRNSVLAGLLLLVSGCVSLDSPGTSTADHGRTNDGEQESQETDTSGQVSRSLAFFSGPEVEYFQVPRELPIPELSEPENRIVPSHRRHTPERQAPHTHTLPQPAVPEALQSAILFPARAVPTQGRLPAEMAMPEREAIADTADSPLPRHSRRPPESVWSFASLPVPQTDQEAEYTTMSGYHDRRPAVGAMSSMPIMTPFTEASQSEGGVVRPDSPEIATDTAPESDPDPDTGVDTIDDIEQISHTHPVDRIAQTIDDPSADGGNPTDSGNMQEAEMTAEEVTANVGEEITIVLQGGGWIFAGERDGRSGLELTSRSAEGDTTEFTFETAEDGPFVAEFVLQDLTEGTSRRHIAEISTDADDENDPFARLSVPERFPSPADALRDNGEQVPMAPQQLLDSTAAGDQTPSAENEQATVGDDQPPRRNVTGYEEQELRSLLEEAMEAENAILADAVVRELNERGLQIDSETLLQAAQLLERGGHEQSAFAAYQAWLADFDGAAGSATVHFSLAGLYEQRGTTSDIRRSSEHYRHVAERYPRSNHATEAERRARRLRRHFVDVR